MDNRTLTIIAPKLSNLPGIDRPIRIVAYCRVSNPSEEQALSLETQAQYYTAKIADFPFGKNAGVFTDTATGRNTKQRPAFKRLMTKCKAGMVDLILTKSISRFGRNFLETIHALRELRSRGVDVYFEQENIHLLDPTVQHVIEIYCALAQNESENKSHDIRWGIKEGSRTASRDTRNLPAMGINMTKQDRLLSSFLKRQK